MLPTPRPAATRRSAALRHAAPRAESEPSAARSPNATRTGGAAAATATRTSRLPQPHPSTRHLRRSTITAAAPANLSAENMKAKKKNQRYRWTCCQPRGQCNGVLGAARRSRVHQRMRGPGCGGQHASGATTLAPGGRCYDRWRTQAQLACLLAFRAVVALAGFPLDWPGLTMASD